MRCSDISRGSCEPLYGSATQGDAYAFIPVPIGLWGENALNSKWASRELLQCLDGLSSSNVRVRLYDPDNELLNQVYAFGDEGRVSLVESALSDFGYVISQEQTKLMFFICVHSRRDACCALYGQSAYVAATKLWPVDSGVLVKRCSHLGGDRFAGTGICFPSGSMYGAFGRDEVGPILTNELAGMMLEDFYRGCVFEEKFAQIVRYAISKYLGYGRFDANVEYVIENGCLNGDVIRIEFHWAGCDYRLTLEKVAVPFASNCKSLNESGVGTRDSLVIRSIDLL